MDIQIEQSGQRLYIRGNTFAIKDALKRAGAHWDPDVRAWWIGAAKRSAIESLIAAPKPAAEPAREAVSPAARVIRGRAEYKGKTYYILAHGQSRNDGSSYAKLCSRDGSMVFWASKEHTLRILKTYDKPTSIQSLRDYADRMKSARHKFGDGMCDECGERRAITTASDSSGLIGAVCGRCASMSRFDRSFA